MRLFLAISLLALAFVAQNTFAGEPRFPGRFARGPAMPNQSVPYQAATYQNPIMPTENLPPATDKQSAANRPTAPYGYSAAPHGPPPRYNKQAAIGAYGNAVYPKYIYGFHYREFQNIGLPHGDIGTLGNGMTRNPW